MSVGRTAPDSGQVKTEISMIRGFEQLFVRPVGRVPVILTVAAGLAWVTACRGRDDSEASEAAREAARGEEAVEAADDLVVITIDDAGSVLADVWLRLSEPEAVAEVSRDLRSVARTMRMQADEPVDSADAGRLRARADELDEVARQVLDGEMPVNQTVRDVFARAHNTLSRHHLGRARSALGRGDRALAGHHLHLAMRELQTARSDAQLGSDPSMDEHLAQAREAADTWKVGSAVLDEGRLLDEISDDQQRLANALGARRH